jgi:hypothetical protein
MRGILETQRKHISETEAKLNGLDERQLRMTFGERDEEREQLERNRRYWEQRLEMLERELRTEPDRIRELYSVQAERIEPVGLVYLWPVTG